MTSPRLDLVDPAVRAAAAERIRVAYDVEVPRLRHFNYSPCEDHSDLEAPNPLCRRCGIKFRRHQRVAIMWLWLVKKGLIADPTGSGKTHVVTGLLSILKETGELDWRRNGGRVLIICDPGAVRQWRRELRRAVPGLIVEIAEGTRPIRSQRYGNPWDVLITGHQMFLRDQNLVRNLGIKTLVVDDVDALRHGAGEEETKTARAVRRIGHENERCDRIILLNATPLQKRLLDLYDYLIQIGGQAVLGPRAAFERRHVVREPRLVFNGNGRPRTEMVIVQHRHLDVFQEQVGPMVLRRPVEALDDVNLPEVFPNDVMLELYPAQRERYAELQDGVLRLIREEGTDIKRVTALAKIMYGTKICEGLAALEELDGPGTSVKFDWIMNKLRGEWEDDGYGNAEKIVVFIHYKPAVRAMRARLEQAGIGHVLRWGEERRANVREAELDRFDNDPECRVLIGTTSIVRSINLQVARNLVNVDQISNQASMTQLAGRVRRDGSKWHSVFVHNLLAADTHEERLLESIQSEAALDNAVWSDSNPLFRHMNPIRLLQAIAPGGTPRRRLRAAS